MWFHASAMMLRLLPFVLPLLLQLPVQVTARFCEGGHICSLPRECCTLGCCPPYQGGPRQLPPPSEHVLNLFFISHWFFWCVVVAIILAILCAYSLWKKRRTLCGWGFTEHHTQSEGDSAGSCYAPPQYSRCNSFHHPPPPYTEVTSKPDLYPLVFTCNSDNSKGNAGGSSYLMVQYFRNYIVRPAGSLSAASTVDSLSSSFICNINEANTLVPPPYSRAASPELSLHYAGAAAHREQTSVAPHTQSQMMSSAPQYAMPRSASQLVEPDYQPRQMHYATVALGGNMGVGAGTAHYSTRLHASHSGHFSPDESGNESGGGGGRGGGGGVGGGVGFLQSQSDQHFRYMGNNSSSSLSDIFVNNSCAAGLGTGMDATTAAAAAAATAAAATSLCSLAMAGSGTSMMYGSGSGCIQSNPLHSLENCCQLAASTADVAAAAATTAAVASGGGATASTVSGVSSLSNIGTPTSPPQATSPTGEVREILDQISQLQADVNYEQLLLNSSKPRLQHTLSTPMPRPATLQQQHQQQQQSMSSTSKGKKYYASKPPNKALYIPMAVMTPPTAQRCVLKSPISSVVSGANFFVNRGRVARKGWITRSAPTTPGSGLPPNRLGDDSPLLLNEHDEDAIDGHGHGQLE